MRGWWKKATEEEKERAKKYLRFHKDSDVHWEFIRGATASVARTTIISMQVSPQVSTHFHHFHFANSSLFLTRELAQDVMGLDNNARMNIPATQAGNWGWRIGESAVFEKLEKEQKRLRKFLCRYNRVTPEFFDKCSKVYRSKRPESAPSSTASSMARTIGKSLESLTGMNMSFLSGDDVVQAKDNVDKAAKEAKDKVTKEAPGTFEKLKDKLKDKASQLKEKTTGEKLPKDDDKHKPKEKPKDDKPKENGKDKGKDNPKKK